MSLIELAGLGAWAQLCMVWIILLMAQKRVRLLSPKVDETVATPGVTVIVPACNEAAVIARCIQSIQRQQYIQLRIVVVDDRSSDATAAIVEQMAIGDPRLQLLQIKALPAGWMGKSHALWRGAQLVGTPWLLFLDADCLLLHDNAVRAAIDHATHSKTDLLTLWPRHDAGSWSEALFIPLAAAVMALWFGRSNQDHAAAFGNGQFLLVKNVTYKTVGGHEQVRSALIEDVPLAQLIRQAGYTTRCAGGRDLVSVRMYDCFQGVFYGWSRIYIGALQSATRIMLSMLWVLISSAWPLIASVLLLFIGLRADDALPVAYWFAWLLTAAHLLLLLLVSRGFWKMGGCDRRYLWLYPVSVAGVLAILLHAWMGLALRRQVKWRTTVYRFDRRARITGASDGNPADQTAQSITKNHHAVGALAAGGGDGLRRPAALPD